MSEMCSFERFQTLMEGRRPDCVPVFPVLLLQGAHLLNLPLAEYLTCGRHLAEGQLRLWRKFGHDCVVGVPHVVEDLTAFGAELSYHPNGPPGLDNMVIERYEQIEQLEIPDPHNVPLLQETLSALHILAGELKGEVPILGACIAPFSLPSMLMGTEQWMELLFFEPPERRQPLFQRLMEIGSEFCSRWANAQLAAGADAVILADGMASSAVINRQQFIDLALPVTEAVVSRIQGKVIHEGIGHIYPIIDLLPATGVAGAFLSYRDDLATCRQMVGASFVLMGNLNNIAMRRWTPAEMAQHARAVLQAGASQGSFILAAQGPEIPLGVPDEVIQVMVESAHTWKF